MDGHRRHEAHLEPEPRQVSTPDEYLDAANLRALTEGLLPAVEPGYKSTSADKAEQTVAHVDAMLGKRPVSTTITQVHPKHAMSQFAYPDSVAPLPWPARAKFDSDAYLKMWRQYHPPLREMVHTTPQFLTLRSVLWKAVS